MNGGSDGNGCSETVLHIAKQWVMHGFNMVIGLSNP